MYVQILATVTLLYDTALRQALVTSSRICRIKACGPACRDMHATRLGLVLSCIFLIWTELSSLSCSDMLDKAIDTLEQRILDVEADIESAESEAKGSNWRHR